MWVIASVFNAIFSVILAPFRSLPGLGLLVISVATGVVMLLIFGKTSNQAAIRRVKSRMKAHIAEIWLFRDDLVQMLLATGRVLAYTGGYLAHSLRPLIFIFIPVLIIMAMLAVRFEHRPLRPDESAIFAVWVDDASWTRGDAVTLRAPEGIRIVSPPLRIPARREINWKIAALTPGDHRLTVSTPRGEAEKRILVSATGSGLSAIAPSRGRAFSGRFLEFPAEPPLAASVGIRGIEVVGWPLREMHLLGLKVHWLVAFFVLSLAAGFAVKGAFRVEV